jgi:hypothetical protein
MGQFLLPKQQHPNVTASLFRKHKYPNTTAFRGLDGSESEQTFDCGQAVSMTHEMIHFAQYCRSRRANLLMSRKDRSTVTPDGLRPAQMRFAQSFRS